ncbi:MAG TPA: hypothetical protein PLL06_00275 [Acidobacteriota bacterium]|nr:hypothetical protein [Acidobacteriota bacterium]HNC44621.1 hypothetical protein [Acidobacteriota bacterium]HNG91302.1 hypothetical protein [Acidobacteriota bacterium]
MRRQISKAKGQRYHAKERALERYGLVLTRAVYREWVKLIQSHKATFVSRTSCRLTKFIVHWQGQDFPVVYDSVRKAIVTVLPNEALESTEFTSPTQESKCER